MSSNPPASGTPQGQGLTANPQLSATDPAGVWRAVLDAVGQSNAAAWMDHFRLQSIDTSANPAVALITPTMSFAGGAANVATGLRLQRVADTITQLLGTPVRAELAAPPSQRPGGPSRNTNGGSDSTIGNPPGGDTSPRSAGTSGGSSSGGGSGGGGVDRRDALNLPLVRDVFEIFPDASLINTRREQPPPSPPSKEEG